MVATTALTSALAPLSKLRPPVALFLDYDGTLTPIVSRPELAVLSPTMRAALVAASRSCSVAIVSGRDRRDVEQLVGVSGITYAGSHGFDIRTADGRSYEQGAAFLAALDRVEAHLRAPVSEVAGAQLERKRFAVAVHFRRVAPELHTTIEEIVTSAAATEPTLRRTGGKRVFELRPNIPWDKGKAVELLIRELGAGASLPIYIGDDETDEDAFRVVRDRGVGIVVRDEPRPTLARYALDSTDEVRLFLERLARALS